MLGTSGTCTCQTCVQSIRTSFSTIRSNWGSNLFHKLTCHQCKCRYFWRWWIEQHRHISVTSSPDIAHVYYQQTLWHTPTNCMPTAVYHLQSSSAGIYQLTYNYVLSTSDVFQQSILPELLYFTHITSKCLSHLFDFTETFTKIHHNLF